MDHAREFLSTYKIPMQSSICISLSLPISIAHRVSTGHPRMCNHDKGDHTVQVLWFNSAAQWRLWRDEDPFAGNIIIIATAAVAHWPLDHELIQSKSATSSRSTMPPETTTRVHLLSLIQQLTNSLSDWLSLQECIALCYSPPQEAPTTCLT